MAVASTQATIPKPPQGGGGRPRSKSQPRKRDATAAGVQGAARDTGGAGTPLAGVAEQSLKSPVRPGVAQRSIAGPSPGGGIRGRWLRSPSRIKKADFRPSKRYMKRSENINWPLR